MPILFTEQQFDESLSRSSISIECDGCKTVFARPKNQIQSSRKKGQTTFFCSRTCRNKANQVPRTKGVCTQCSKEIYRKNSQIKLYKQRGYKNQFCSSVCSGIYNAQHRTTGTRRAKLELWLEKQLRVLYPNLTVLYNDTSVIKAELDIYIPSQNLAFELNGIFHYEPIYGQGKLDRTQNKDIYKLHACTRAGIDLCVIDTSMSRYFKPKTSQRFLDIITQIIDERLGKPKMVGPEGFAPSSAV